MDYHMVCPYVCHTVVPPWLAILENDTTVISEVYNEEEPSSTAEPRKV